MKIINLSSKEYSKFVNASSNMTFHQDERWGALKQATGWSYELVGAKEKNKVVAAALLLYKKLPLGIKISYSPRGFILDYNNLDLVGNFSNALRKYLKSKKVTFLKIEPYVVYKRRDSNGEELENYQEANALISKLKELKYHHHGLSKGIENELQPRWIYRLRLDKSYEELEKDFSKSTRKNIESCHKKGLRVRKGNLEDLETVVNILEDSSKRKSFILRSFAYYKQMHESLGDMMTMYIAHINTEAYLNYAKESLNKEKDNNADISQKMKGANVGSKLINRKKTSDNLLLKYEKELEEAKAFAKDYPRGKDIATLISITAGDEHLSLNSGMLSEYKSFTPKYAMYEAHIKEALALEKKWSNFYGISGYFSKENNPMYGVYEFKKGFGGEVHELVGEFDLAISPFKFRLYNLAFAIYHKLKKLKSKKKS